MANFAAWHLVGRDAAVALCGGYHALADAAALAKELLQADEAGAAGWRRSWSTAP